MKRKAIDENKIGVTSVCDVGVTSAGSDDHSFRDDVRNAKSRSECPTSFDLKNVRDRVIPSPSPSFSPSSTSLSSRPHVMSSLTSVLSTSISSCTATTTSSSAPELLTRLSTHEPQKEVVASPFNSNWCTQSLEDEDVVETNELRSRLRRVKMSDLQCIDRLPFAIHVLVAGCFGLKDYLRLGRCSQHWRRVCRDPSAGLRLLPSADWRFLWKSST
jgi:hypothetical protein